MAALGLEQIAGDCRWHSLEMSVIACCCFCVILGSEDGFSDDDSAWTRVSSSHWRPTDPALAADISGRPGSEECSGFTAVRLSKSPHGIHSEVGEADNRALRAGESPQDDD